MNEAELIKKVTVRPWSTITLGKNVLCDGFEITDTDEKRGLAFFSHIHDDHSEGFERALGKCDYVCVSKQSKELFVALHGNWLKKRKNLVGLEFGEPFNYNNEKITLYETDHILGSSQILLEDMDGTRIVYSGDFNMPYTKSIQCDVLVLDTVHGDPQYSDVIDPDQMIKELMALIGGEIKKGRPVIIRSYRGKLQKIMHTLREKIDSPIPFVASTIDCRLADVYGHYNMETDGILPSEGSEFQELEQTNEIPYVRFTETGGPLLPGELTEIMRIRVGSPHEPSKGLNHSINLTDHANFLGILEYVKLSNPKLVITDNSRRSRSGLASTLASEINTKLGIKALPLP